MGTNVKSYTDEQLLNRVKSLDSFNGIPEDYWILGVQSNEDETNKFDDKFYVFKGEEFVMVTTGTTNAGINGLKGYDKYNKYGVAVWKTDEWCYGVWKFGKHKGKMDALRQVKPIKYYRDGDKDGKAEQLGKMYEGIIYVNFHCNTYNEDNTIVRDLIGGWSLGCQVCNNTPDYYEIIDLTKKQSSVTYCLIEEF